MRAMPDKSFQTLAVDDDADRAKISRRAMRRFGHTCLTDASISDAADAARIETLPCA